MSEASAEESSSEVDGDEIASLERLEERFDPELVLPELEPLPEPEPEPEIVFGTGSFTVVTSI